jgi:hypothetical protein
MSVFNLHFGSDSKLISGAHPASYPMAARFLSLGTEQLGHETNHSSPCSAKISNVWNYAPP